MKFCQNHWDKLRAAIKARGLIEFVALDGKEAATQMIGELKGEAKTRKNFDPLMASHWAIANNAMDAAGRMGVNPLGMLMHDPEHPERECPICFLNWICAEHDRQCTNPDCKQQKGMTFDHWIDCAADEMKEKLSKLPPA